jgi:D-alanine-D-alanine ligase
MSDSLQRVLVVYNTDYDEELTAGSNVDVSAVEQAARAMTEGIRSFGLDSELAGVHGRDLDQLFRRLRDDPPQLVFNACESLCGDVRNEALMPALLDMLRIPYTGPDALAIGLCLHKDRAKDVLRAAGIPTPPHVVLAGDTDLDAELVLDYPFFLKLVHEDASIGIEAGNVVADRDALRARARELIGKYRQPVIAEKYIDGREVNVTVMGGSGQLACLPLHEISFADMPADRPRIVSYAAKWDEHHVDYAGTKPVPMKDVSDAVADAIRAVAISAFVALGLRDFGRVDLRVDADGRPWVIDINPNCDLSPDAGVARTARAAGMEYPQLLGRICELAWSRRG